MDEQRGTRRWLLGVLMAASAAMSSGHGASATDNGPRPRPDYASKEAFRLECELLGGTFSEGVDGIACHLAGVGTVHCDGNGKNCEYTPASWQRPPGGENSYDGSVDEVATDDQPSVVAPADGQEPKVTAKHGKGKKGKHGKKHGHGGKGRK